MTINITLADPQSFLEGTKMQLASLDTVLATEFSMYVLGRLADTYNDPGFGVPTWTTPQNTPELVRMAIAMLYAGWAYDRQYSEVMASAGTGGQSYGAMLRTGAENLIDGIISSSIMLAEIQPNIPAIAPVFYPTDTSSQPDLAWNRSDPSDHSIGPAAFGMSKVF